MSQETCRINDTPRLEIATLNLLAKSLRDGKAILVDFIETTDPNNENRDELKVIVEYPNALSV